MRMIRTKRKAKQAHTSILSPDPSFTIEHKQTNKEKKTNKEDEISVGWFDTFGRKDTR